jgi:hypothetical protein
MLGVRLRGDGGGRKGEGGGDEITTTHAGTVAPTP